MTPEQKAHLKKIIAVNGECRNDETLECFNCPLERDCGAEFAARSLLESGKEKRKEKWVPKVGERVAVYDANRELFGDKGVVTWLLPHGRLYVQLDRPTAQADTPRLHSKQCRRLTRKTLERREWWVVEYSSGATVLTHDAEGAKQFHEKHGGKVYRVREVKAAKGGER